MITSLPPKDIQVASPIVVGANHQSSTMMMRDRIYIEDHQVPVLLANLAKQGIDQAIILSTCDRVEVIGFAVDADAFESQVLSVLAATGDCDISDLKEQTYMLFGDEAVSHVFSVTASLDSLMVGEPQVLGQVKQAHRLAQDAGFVGAQLETLMQSAYSAAKRVRTETKIGEGPIGMAASAVQIARDVFGDLKRCKALLVGTGDMGELIVRDLLSAGVSGVTVIHQRAYRATDLAADLAQEFDATVGDFVNLDSLLCDHDIVVSALGSRTFRLEKPSVAAAIKKRRYKPLFIIDTGVPRDVKTEVDTVEEAFLYGLNDLEQVAMKGRLGREREAQQAKDMIAETVTAFAHERLERNAVPTLVRLRTYFESERQQALADGGDDADKATRLLVGRLLHGPSESLRTIAANDEIALAQLEYALKMLFNLYGQDTDQAINNTENEDKS